jgi:hypothetical protein
MLITFKVYNKVVYLQQQKIKSYEELSINLDYETDEDQ